MRWGQAARRGGLVLLGLGGFGLLGLVLLATPPGNELLRWSAVRLAARALPDASLQVDGLETHLFDGVALTGLSLSDTAGRNLISVDRLSVEWDLRAALRRRLLLPSIGLDGLMLDLGTTDQGALRLVHALGLDGPPQATPTPWSGLPLEVILHSLAVHDGELLWDGGHAQQVELSLSGRGRGRTIELREIAASARLAQPLSADATVRGGLQFSDGDLSLHALRAQVGEASLDLSGLVRGIEMDPVLDLQVGLGLPPGPQLGAVLGTGAPAGEVSAAGSISGGLADLQTQLLLSAQAGGSAQVHVRMDLTAQHPAWTLNAVGEDLDFSALFPQLLTEAVGARELLLTVTGSGLTWPDAMHAYVQLRANDALLWGQELPAMTLAASLHDGLLDTHELWLSHGSGELSAFGILNLLAKELDLQAQLVLPKLHALSALAHTPLSGSLTWSSRLQLSWLDSLSLRAIGPAQVSDLGVAGVTVTAGAGTLDAVYDDSGLQLSWDLAAHKLSSRGVAVDSAGVALVVSVPAQGQPSVSALIDARAVSLDQAAAVVGTAVGKVSVQMPAEGPPIVTAHLQVDDLLPTGDLQDGRARGTLDLTLKKDQLSALVDIDRDGGGQLIGAELHGDLSGDGSWTVERLVLEPLAGLRLVSDGAQVIVLGDDGLAALQVRLTGSAGALGASLEPESRQLRLQGSQLDLGQILSLRKLTASASPASSPGGDSDSLAGLAAVGDVDLVLGLSPQGQPVNIEGTLSARGLVVPEKVSDVDLNLRVDGLLSKPHLALTLGDSQTKSSMLLAEGQIPLDLERGSLACGQGGELSVILPPSDQSMLAAHLPGLPAGEGRISAAVDASGDVCDPVLHAVAALDGPAGRSGEVVRLDIELDRADDLLSVSGFAEEGFHRRVMVQGTAQTRLHDALAAILSGQEIDLADPRLWADQLQLSLVPLDLSVDDLATFIDVPTGIGGRLAGGFVVTGSPTSPTLSGALQFIDAHVGAVPVSSGLLMLLPADGGYDLTLDLALAAVAGEAELAAASGATLEHPDAGRELHVTGFVPVSPTDKALAAEGVDLSFNGALPLAVLSGVAAGVSDPWGELKVDGRLTGSLGTPVVQADLSMRAGGLSYAPLGLTYDNLSFGLRVADDQLMLKTLMVDSHRRSSLLSGRGGKRLRRLTASGRATLSDLKPVDVDAKLSLAGFWLIASQDHDLALSGDLELAGPWPAPRLTGALRVDASQLFFGEDAFVGDRSLAIDRLIEIQRSKLDTVVALAVDPGPAAWQLFDIDVDLDLQRNLRLGATVPLQSDYGQQFAQLSSVGLDAELGGELRIRQSEQKMTLEGTVETLRGTATALGVPFDVRGGSISFLGDSVDNPLVDIDAVRHTGSYGDVNVNVSGFVDSLSISPTSEGYPDKTDVVTLLLFGKPASEMANSEGAAGSQVVAATLSALTGGVGQALGSTVFDELEIDTSAVRVGWALSDRLFLSLQRRFVDNGTDNQTEVTLEYLISRRLYAEFTTGDRAASSANLYWRWRF